MRLLAVISLLVAQAEEKLPLNVLYVGSTDTPRGKEYVEFLQRVCQGARGASIGEFDPRSAHSFHAIVLDWSEDGTLAPLGDRDAWNKPAVLIGSAGRLLAEKWQLSGGFG